MIIKKNYGESFAYHGVGGMGRGSPWGAINNDGVLVWMGHQRAFKPHDGIWQYEDKGLTVNATWDGKNLRVPSSQLLVEFPPRLFEAKL